MTHVEDGHQPDECPTGECRAGKTPQAAVALVERSGKLLAVWNRRYEGWSMPGGKVEPGEEVKDACARELREETGLTAVERAHIYTGLTDSPRTPDRGRICHVFRVVAWGDPREMEEGCPVRWMTREEFLAESPFKDFYARMWLRLLDDALAASKAEVERVRGLIHRDRTGLAAAIGAMMHEATSRLWVTEGRGAYEWDDNRYKEEAGVAMRAVIEIGKNALNASGRLADLAFHPEKK